jgi:hypothetical protein
MANALAALVGERAAFQTGAYSFEDATPGSLGSGPHSWNPAHAALGTARMPRQDGLPPASLWPTPVGLPSTLTTGSGVLPHVPRKEGTSPALLGALTVLGLALLGLGAFGINELAGGASRGEAVPELAPAASVVPEPAPLETALPEVVPAPPEVVPSAAASASAAETNAPPSSEKKPTKATKPAGAAKPAATPTNTGSRPAWGF